MRYGSVCSGIEAATVAWHPLGWEPQFFSEIEAFPSAVLAHHYHSNMPGQPAGNGVPNHGDMLNFQDWPDHAIELLVGGTPCQDFSVAGLRAGLAAPRGNLTLTYLGVVAKYQPKWVVWENVPGVLSVDGGRAFGAFLGGLAELGYGFAYRVLDAQFVRASGLAYAVPQRRRRVFVVGYFGDWRRAAAVLFDGASLRGDSPPRREQREDVTHPIAPSLTSSGRGIERTGDTRGQDPVVAVQVPSTGDLSHCLNAGGMGRIDYETETMIATSVALRGREGGGTAELGGDIATALRASTGGGDKPHVLTNLHVDEVAGTMKAIANSGGWSNSVDHAAGGYMIPVSVTGDISHTLKAEGFDASEDGTGRGTPLVPIAFHGTQDPDISGDVAHPLGRNQGQETAIALPADWKVRRLTPVECHRLQGFPDDYLGQVMHRGKPSADGPQYKALGNSMAVNVMRVIGERIAMVDALAGD